jgi:hypothetical protein
MDDNLQNIEDLFRAALKENEEKPSPKVWNELDKKLDKENLKKLKGKFNTLKKLSILLLFLLSITIINNYRQSLFTGNHVKINSNAIAKLKNSQKNTIVDRRSNNSFDRKGAVLQKIGSSSQRLSKKYLKGSVTSTTEKENLSLPGKMPSRLNRLDNIFSTEKRVASETMSTGINRRKISDVSRNDEFSINEIKNQNENALLKKNSTHSSLKSTFLGNIPEIVKLNKFYISTEPVSNVQLRPGAIVMSNSRIQAGNEAKSKTGIQHQARSEFFLNPFFSPDFAWSRLQDDNVGNQLDSARLLEKEEKSEFSYTLGVLTGKKISSHFTLESGLTFSNTNISLEPKFIYAQPDFNGITKYRVNTSSGYGYVLPTFSQNPAPGDSLYMYTSSETIQYLGVPLGAFYSIGINKFKVSFGAGISMNLLSRAKLEINLENGSRRESEILYNLVGTRKVYFSGFINTEAGYYLNKQIAITLRPTFKFAINSIDHNATVKSYPLTFGTQVGFRCDL